MAANEDGSDLPPWKKHLIARLRVKNNKQNGNPALTVSATTTTTPIRKKSCPLSSTTSGRAPIAILPSTSSSSTSCSSNNNGFNNHHHNHFSSSRTSPKNNHDVVVLNGENHASAKQKKMVQERCWTDYASCDSMETLSSENYENYCFKTTSDSDSSEELHYGPGIVSKLKNKYLSLTLRGDNYGSKKIHQRPSILHLRKATSLEDLLDDEEDDEDDEEEPQVLNNGRAFVRYNKANSNNNNGSMVLSTFDKNSNTNRYRNTKRGVQEIKRARSVEAISRLENNIVVSPPQIVEKQRPKSFLLDYNNDYSPQQLIERGNDDEKGIIRKLRDKPVASENNSHQFINNNSGNNKSNAKVQPRLNRPKRIAPIMNEREKPPADYVKQAKMIFEKRPEQRTKQPVATGEVAAKIASYKNIIVQSKPAKKPSIKAKPMGDKNNEKNVTKNKNNNNNIVKSTSPNGKNKKTVVENEKETTKLNGNAKEASVESKTSPRIKETSKKDKDKDEQQQELPSPKPDVSLIELPKNQGDFARLCVTPDLIMTTTPTAVSTPRNEDIVEGNVGTKEPLVKVEEDVDLVANFGQNDMLSPISAPPPLPVRMRAPAVIAEGFTRKLNEGEGGVTDGAKGDGEKATTKVVVGSGAVTATTVRCQDRKEDFVPKKVRRPPPCREPETNSIVFKFTDRKDVPDYVQNDRSRTVGKLEKPKVGEGGIILLPGASIDESFTDEDEEIMKFLQAPPSPCDVTFINDNVLIDGKSSINQKTKRSRLRISFVESGPDVFEYPSESSLLVDEPKSPISPTPASPMAGHTVPMLSGSTLANYTPKTTETFQPGVTRSVPNHVVPAQQATSENLPDDTVDLLEEVDQPIAFSAGANSDMLF